MRAIEAKTFSGWPGRAKKSQDCDRARYGTFQHKDEGEKLITERPGSARTDGGEQCDRDQLPLLRVHRPSAWEPSSLRRPMTSSIQARSMPQGSRNETRTEA